MTMICERLARMTTGLFAVPAKCPGLKQIFLRLDKSSLPNVWYVPNQRRIFYEAFPCHIQCRRHLTFKFYKIHNTDSALLNSYVNYTHRISSKRHFSDYDEVKAIAANHEECGADVARLALEIINTSCKLDVMAASLQPRFVENLLQELSLFGFPEKCAVSMLSGRIWLLQDSQAVLGIAETLAYYGFGWRVMLKLLEGLPSQYCNQESPLGEIVTLIKTSLMQLRSQGFASQALSQIINRNPCILLVEQKKLMSTMMKLKSIFTSSDAIEVSIKCPNVYFQPWKKTNTIFDYAFFKMGYSQAQIVRSGVLSCSLEYLQDRHVFLKRVGIFYDVKKKDDPRLNPNPSLKHVVKLSDADFARRYGGFSKEGFQVFIAIRDIERENEEKDHPLADNGNDKEYDTDSDFENEVKQFKMKKES